METENKDSFGQTVQDEPSGPILQIKRPLMSVEQYAARENVSVDFIEQCGRLGIIQVRKFRDRSFVVDLPPNPYGASDIRQVSAKIADPAQNISDLAKKYIPQPKDTDLKINSSKAPQQNIQPGAIKDLVEKMVIDSSKISGRKPDALLNDIPTQQIPAVNINQHFEHTLEIVEEQNIIHQPKPEDTTVPAYLKPIEDHDDELKIIDDAPTVQTITENPPTPLDNKDPFETIFAEMIKATEHLPLQQDTQLNLDDELNGPAALFERSSNFIDETADKYTEEKHILDDDRLSIGVDRNDPLDIDIDHTSIDFDQLQHENDYKAVTKLSRYRTAIAVIILLAVFGAIILSLWLYADRKVQLDKLSKANATMSVVLEKSAQTDKLAQNLQSQLGDTVQEADKLKKELETSKAQLQTVSDELLKTKDSFDAIKTRNTEAVQKLNDRIQKLASRLAEMQTEPQTTPAN